MIVSYLLLVQGGLALEGLIDKLDELLGGDLVLGGQESVLGATADGVLAESHCGQIIKI